MNDLPTFHKYTYDQLVAMGKVYYSGKANPFQVGRYEQIQAGLFAELRSIWPEVPDRFSKNTATYLYAAIDRVLWEQKQEEKRILDGMAANAHTAHEQLKHWK